MVFFGFETEGVYVDTNSGYVGVVLVRLYQVEVTAFTFIKAIVSVKFEETSNDGVVTGLAFSEGSTVTTVEYGSVPPVSVVERLLSFPSIHDGIITADEGVTLYDPDEFFDWVVEVKTDFVRTAGDAFIALELELFDEIFVGKLGHTTTFFGIKVDVVNPERSGNKTSVSNTGADNFVGGAVPAKVTEFLEIELQTYFVVLEGNKRKCKTRVAAEPELKRDVQGVLGSAFTGFATGVWFTTGTGIIAIYTRLGKQVSEFRYVTYHLGVTSLFACRLGKFIPDMKPITVLFVYFLSTNINLYILNKTVSNPVEPTEFGARSITFL